MTVAAVVVTYNRKELLCENIEMLLKQTYIIDKIIIVDNHSSDGTLELIESKFSENIDRIQYEYLPDNIGGAGGFEYGCRYAYEENYDFAWLMDDDGKPENIRTLEVLMKEAEKHNGEAVILNSLVTQDGVHLSFGLMTPRDTIEELKAHSENGVYFNYVSAFNGTLVSRKVFENTGFPNGMFFIKGDERDFVDRSRRDGAYIGTVVDSVYIHPEEVLKSKKILGLTVRFNIESPWKEYYKMRNYTYMKKRDIGTIKCYVDFLKDCFRVFVSGCDRKPVIAMMLRGFKDGIKGLLGPTVRP